ncbi:SEL1-like repeat protein [Stappia sp. F7233]|uniref:SEL1-like repeat protein n=1 Tax=Stappia albiluteola TaxID=2758565 RepID=A0A839AK50_9HYPH|nr:peptidoglycan-binding protein [Stappia albiluteola]MBA5779157.1 SEL1-like repeat protein [Stappia albiluteola]
MSWTDRHRDEERGLSVRERGGDAASWRDEWVSPAAGARRFIDRERPEQRAERLTRSSTAVQVPERPVREDLSDIAKSLDRLLPERAQASRERAGSGKAGASDKRANRIEAVLRALDRLDQRVDDLSRQAPDEDERAYRRDVSAAREERALHHRRPEGDPRPSQSRPEPRPRSGHAVRMESGEQADTRALLREISRQIERLNDPYHEAYGAMRDEIASLREAVHAKGGERRDDPQIRRLADAIEDLRTAHPDARLVDDLRAEIGELKARLGQSNVEGQLQTLESGYSHLVERLNELSRSADPALFAGIGQRLREIESAFQVLPSADQMAALEDRVVDMSSRLESVAQYAGGPELRLLGEELRDIRALVENLDMRGLAAGIDERLREVTHRLDDIDRLVAGQRGIAERLANMEDRLPDARAVDRLQERLEQISLMLSEDRAQADIAPHFDARFDDLVDRLDRIEHHRSSQRSYDAAFTLLEKRLAAIDGKIDAFDRPDFRAAAGGLDGEQLARLESAIERLNARLDDGGSGDLAGLADVQREIAELRLSFAEPKGNAGDIEARLRELAEAVSRGGDDKAIALLEGKVARLAAEIDAAESRLANLGRPASRAGADDTSRAVDALRDDLQQLLSAAAAAGRAERPGGGDTGDIQGLLTSIGDRLEALDDDKVEPARVFGKARTGNSPDDDRPLEPGSGKPPAVARGAGQERSARRPAGSPEEEARNRKADFIAAARRAAQAAAAEAAGGKDKTAKAQPSKGRISRSAARQEPVVDAVAAIEAPPVKAQAEEKAGWLKSRLGRKRGKSPTEIPAVELARPSRKDIRAEIAASMANLRADRRPAEDAAGGDEEKKPAAKGGAPMSSRRRALLLAAAAIVLAIGTLQVFRLVSAPADDVAAIETPAPIVSPEVPSSVSQATPPSAPVTPVSAGVVKPPSPPPSEGTAGADATTPGPQTAAPSPRSENGHGERDVAFAPPVGVDSSFVPKSSVQSSAGFAPSQSKAGGIGEPAAEDKVVSLPPEDVGPLALRKAAANGDPRANFEIAARYGDGIGVRPDLAEAARYYQRAAESGLAPAQYRLGSLYEKGQGVAKDIAKARTWYELAAVQGNAKAIHNLAVLHAEGVDGEPDFIKAAEWFEQSAGYGVRDSQYNLGILYARGLGVGKDLVASYKWFALAARQGDNDAAKKRDEVANILSKEELAEARLAVDTWKDVPLAPSSNEVVADPSWVAPADVVSKAALSLGPQEMVLTAQKLLARLGFDPGTADGQIGPKTRDAVIAFQKREGLPATGTIDQDLIKELLGRSI